MKKPKSLYHGHRFPAEVISCSVRWYFPLSVEFASHSYPAAKAEIPELAKVKHVFVKAAARLNNRAENSHQPTRERARAHAWLSRPETHSEISLLLRADPATFRAQAALLRASLYRKQLAARFVAWREFAELAQNLSTVF